MKLVTLKGRNLDELHRLNFSPSVREGRSVWSFGQIRENDVQATWFTYLILMRYCANATASGFPVIVIVRSVAPPSLSSQLLILIMAPEIWRISAILVPPFPMMQPISSFGTVISCVWLFAAGCCLLVLLVRSWLPANAANATWPLILRKY